MEQITLKITPRSDERVFKKGVPVELKITPGMVNYIVGPNGSGKSTLLHAIRAHKDTVYETTPLEKRLDFARGNDMHLYKGVFDIEGLENFEYVFVLDAVEDNPTSFMRASSATALLDGGGYALMHHSRGEGSKMMISRLITDLKRVTGADIDKETKKAVNRPKTRSLVIIDEMDEGLDLYSQSTFCILLNNICRVFNATVLCVCHNPLCILYDTLGYLYPVFDMSDMSYKNITEYIEEQTKYDIVLMDKDEYKEYITWKEGNTKG